MRDIKNEYKELNVTSNVTSEPLQLLGELINLRVDVEGLKGDTTLAIKIEQSKDGVNFVEYATYPVPDEHHGIIFPRFFEYGRYELIVNGSKANMNVTLSF
ncbi:hypothetical protein [Streptomyces californicus]|uniref:hypothetical protein n=1 Tax=Streptomyces californicus TaxID=67351 RepID=UPI0036518C25